MDRDTEFVVLHREDVFPVSKRFIILDLDNCIANDAWRIPLIRWDKTDLTERYDDYHAASYLDEPGNQHLYRGTGLQCAIFTARSDIYMDQTAEWLTVNGVPWRYLIMRKEGDRLPSPELKSMQLDSFLETHHKFEIEMAYDDRPDVIAMYKRRGVKAERRWIHEVETI